MKFHIKIIPGIPVALSRYRDSRCLCTSSHNNSNVYSALFPMQERHLMAATKCIELGSEDFVGKLEVELGRVLHKENPGP